MSDDVPLTYEEFKAAIQQVFSDGPIAFSQAPDLYSAEVRLPGLKYGVLIDYTRGMPPPRWHVQIAVIMCRRSSLREALEDLSGQLAEKSRWYGAMSDAVGTAFSRYVLPDKDSTP